MAFDVVMFGSLSVPQQNVEEWLTTPFQFTGQPQLDEVLQETPEALLAMLGEVICAPHEFFKVTLEEGRVTVQCYASEDSFRETSPALALLFASAADFGGVGELNFAGYQGIRFGERVTLRGGQCAFLKLSGAELAELEQQQAFRSLDARIHERFDALVGRAPATDARGARWAINPFTGRRVLVAAEAR
ncbi:MAG: hypothetical protein DI536_00740 [Archangium gephyra]|uniref:Uncharacterized protein n=1 Tax=Archangium gephyra TaxID=48 RepID=A0A2W5TS59_9BACT|nr:MAG: hypothetical protein DI536_00740 [Archangium gephyra]